MSLRDEHLYEEGLAPLLPLGEGINESEGGDQHHHGEIIVRRRGRKLVGFGLIAVCLATADVALSALCCTGQFSPHWKQYLGLYWLSYSTTVVAVLHSVDLVVAALAAVFIRL